MNTQAEICHICGQPKSSGMTGSFTQWVNSCRCDLLDKEKPQIHICGLCGKPIDVANTGSFTQWVLQSQNCSCPNPMSLEANANGGGNGSGRRNGNPHGASTAAQLQSSGELRDLQRSLTNEIANLDSNNFPIDRYKPISRLGMGGGGLVYLCFDKHLRKNVAVKILRVTQPEQIVQFQAEAKVTAKFKHPNIVSILDFGLTQAGAPFMVLEYVDGKALDALIQERGPLPERVAAELFLQIADALEKGHEYGIFHRDVKSSNIIISQEANGQAHARLIDFGIAMMAGNEDLDFLGQHIVGTPKYMCPDQIVGRKFDARSDLYSFGCVMYETLTGRLPFTGDSMTLLEKHTNERPPSFDEISPHHDISGAMERVVLRCLEKHPETRYQSLTELKTVLKSADGEDIVSASSVMKTISSDVYERAIRAAEEQSRVPSQSDASISARTEYGDASSYKAGKADKGNQLIVGLVALLGIGMIAFVGYLVLRPDETEDAEIVSYAKNSDRSDINAIGEPASEDEIKGFDKFESLAPLNAQAIKLEKAFKFAAAEAAYTRAIELDKETSQWYRYRGISRMNQGKYDEALSDFDEAIEREKTDDNYRARAELYFNSEEFQRADQDIHAAIQIGPNKPDNYLLLARLNSDPDDRKTEDLERARHSLEIATKLEPGRPEPIAQRLIVEFKLHSNDLNSTLKQVKATVSDSAFVPFCLGRYSSLRHQWSDANYEFTKAIALNPVLWQAYEMRANAFRELGVLAGKGNRRVSSAGEKLSADECNSHAMSDYYKANSLNPKSVKLLVEIAQFHREQEQVESEIKYLSQAIDLSPNSWKLYAMRAAANHIVQKNVDAVDDCESAIIMGDKSSSIYLLKANSLVDLDKATDAETAFAACLKADPNNVDALMSRAKFRQKQHDYRNAISDFEQVLKIIPNDQDAIDGKHQAIEQMTH